MDMTQSEYIIMQEGDVRAYESLLPSSGEELAKMYVESTLRSYQVGHLVLTNYNLFFVVTGVFEGLVARELARRTPFGLGRKLISGKKLSLDDVYRYLNNPGSIKIPLSNVLRTDYKKHFLSGATLTVAFRTESEIKLYSFYFPGIGDKSSWKKMLDNAVLNNGGRVDYAWWLEKTKPCPVCGYPMFQLPLIQKWYCSKCKKYYE